MPLTPGTRLGPYEVTAQIGAGGMGEVYRARDVKLGRDVALKILPETFVGDAERVARFEREAQLLAALNHPHIAAIYGLETGAGPQFLVLELVDGDTLAQRLEAGPLAVDEALRIARQIADALQAAHEKGIIHRDLKPANIALTHDGQVKVLDFGLAKAMDGDGSGSPSTSPTLTFAATQAGVILGTAAYMSPEQAKGRAADKRGDVWAFGCVLFEMLAGRRAFEGEDISDTLAAVLRGDPDWAALPATIPPAIRSLIERCLKKDRQQRIADIAVAQFLLSEPGGAISTSAAPATTSPIATRPSRGWNIAAAAFAVTTVAAATAAAMLYLSAPAKVVTRFLVSPPERTAFVTAGRTGSSVAISPDGRRLAFTARDDAGKILIWLRPIDSLVAQPLPGTDNAEFPFWSPDSRSLGYFANDKLVRIDAAGGPTHVICDAAGARGGVWGREGLIVFGAGSLHGLSRVAAGGGPPTAATTADVGDHRFPSFLPDGRHVLFYLNDVGAPDKTGLYLTSLDSPQPKRLAAAESGAVYAAPGLLLFVRQTTLVAQPFDLRTLSLTGEPTPVAEGVEAGVFAGILAFSVSESGVLAYGLGTGRSQNQQLMVFDRQGKVIQTLGAPGNYIGLDVSPDEKQVVAHRHDQAAGGDLWLLDIARGTTSRFTFDAAQDNSSPVWSPDGGRIAYASLRNGRWGLYVKPSNMTGTEELLTQPATVVAPRSWSKDGNFLAYGVVDPATQIDVLILPLAGDRKPVPVLNTRFNERSPQISPDGKWLAYSSDEGGAPELFVRPFPSGDGKWQISTGGGSEPRWRGDSRELFFTDRPQLGSMMAVDIKSAGTVLSAGTPRKLFDMNTLGLAHPGVAGTIRFAVSRDGQRFFIPNNPRATTFSDATSHPLAVVLNWVDSLRK